MKSDSSRLTFDQRKHFSSVRMQQGRVQVDADWNEQADIAIHRVETEASDVIGLCGAPQHYPAFHIVAAISQLSPEEQALDGNKTLPAGFATPDFLISAGRYYVDGILCENEQLTSYNSQPDLLKLAKPPLPPVISDPGLYLVYVDVWQRLLTAIDDPSVREVALGGPDTATRTKTVWQVKHWFAGTDPGNCATKFAAFEALIAPSDGKLSARSKRAPGSTDPCIVPPGAGYTGLENQLYRVEIHAGGEALNATSGGAGTLATRVTGHSDQIKVSGVWAKGQAIEIFSDDDPMIGTLANVTKVESSSKKGPKTLTLDIDVSQIALDDLHIREAKATFKWSRDNGVVVTTIQSINGKEVTVHDLGPDDALGFKEGQWIEIIDDGLELNGLPGQLALITGIDSAINLITLNVAPTLLDATELSGVNQSRHPKLRRWDGVGAVKFHPNISQDHFLDLESGVQIRFFEGSFKTGDYWTAAARTATADAQSGSVEWPLDGSSQPLAQLPFGIKHHYCRLAMLHWNGSTFDVIQDCRNLFPPLTELTSLFYVSGDGQEVMPDLTRPAAFVPLAQQLIVGVANGEVPVANAEVRFLVTKGNGRVLPASGPGTFRQVNATTLDVLTDQNGLARCTWELDSTTHSQQLKASMQSVTDLTDASDHPVHIPIIFTANLSIASQVAYQPGDCVPFQEDKTVQKAIDRLAHLISLYEVSGNNQEILPGEPLQPLVVLAANRCGPVTDQTLKVHFKVISGGGTVNGLNEVDVVTNNKGLASCVWAPGPSVVNQEVEASLVIDAAHAVTAPTSVRFTSTLDQGGGACDVTVGKGGDFERLDQAIGALIERQTDICICLLPGDHVMDKGLRIEGRRIHVKITGCGRGSRLIFPEAPFMAIGLASLTIRDVEILALNSFMTIERCEDVSFAACYLIQENQKDLPFIRIARSAQIRFEGNVVSATMPMTVKTHSPFTVFPESLRQVRELFLVANRFEFERGALQVASELAKQPARDRQNLAKDLGARVESSAKTLTSRELESYSSLVVTMRAQNSDATLLQENLQDIRLASLATMPGLAIVLMDAEAETRIEDNQISGVVSLYGMPGLSRLNQQEMDSIMRSWKAGSLAFRESLANLQVRNNVIHRLDVSEETVKSLKGVTPSKPFALVRRYRRCFITNNAFMGGGNFLLMEHLALTSNSFDRSGAVAGTVVAQAAIYVGNYAPSDGQQLFNLSRMSERAANLMINIT